ncbi:hypothetical protein N9A81_00745 [Synechococcus sp. AH-707-M23]|nr:hypothetical protein [Synechococcus sp. AH-707-M23]
MSKACARCLHEDVHPFGISYIDNLCSGCHVHNEKNFIDWHLRSQYLYDIASNAKKSRILGSTYDCVVPIKGIAEDYYVIEQVLKLDLNPLIVAVNDYFFNDIGWHNLHNLITVFDLDSQIYSPNLHEYKELISTSFRKHLHILYPSLSLNSSYPIHVAIERNIPLIIWGQLQAIEQVGKFSHLDLVEMTKWSHIEHDRIGLDIDQLIGNGAQLNPQHLNYYEHPLKAEVLGSKAPTGIYLSNYMRWDPLQQNHSTLKYGFKPQFESTTFDPYERSGSSVYYTIHDISRLSRHGYRKVRDHINREIRHNRIDKSNGIELYNYYKSKKVNLNPFFDWLGVSDSGKEWILKHLLFKLNDLIGEDQDSQSYTLPDLLPDSIKNMVRTSHLQTNQFIPFAKGI